MSEERTNERHHQSLTESFHLALRKHPARTHETMYILAGRRVRMRIVGDRLAQRLAPSMLHLMDRSDGEVGAGLEIDLWDQEETGIYPETDARPDLLGITSQFEISGDRRFATSVLQYSVSSFDREREQIVGFATDAERLTLYEVGRPLHVPLSLWHTDCGTPLIHAGFVADGTYGVLLIGASGSGKTTSSLACLRAGWDYLADDLIALEIAGNGATWGHSAYSSAFVDDRTAACVCGVPGETLQGRYDFEDKRLLLVPPHACGALVRRARIRAMALVRTSSSPETTFRLVARGQALLEALHDGLQIGVLNPGRAGFEGLGNLVERVRTYRVNIGTKTAGIPGALRDLLAEANRAANTERRR